MGMHIGLIAVRANVSDLRAAFSTTWEKYEVVSSAEGLSGYDAMLNWKQSNEQFVSAADWSLENPGTVVHVFFQDGPWAVMLESSFVLASDEKALSRLSSQFGLALSFLVESAAGCAFFWCFESGLLRRSLSNNGESTEVSGMPLREEAGIDIENYYMEETERLMEAFGLSNLDASLPSAAYQAISAVDRTDYGAIRNADVTVSSVPLAQPPPPSLPKKPWWKVW